MENCTNDRDNKVVSRVGENRVRDITPASQTMSSLLEVDPSQGRKEDLTVNHAQNFDRCITLLILKSLL